MDLRSMSFGLCFQILIDIKSEFNLHDSFQPGGLTKEDVCVPKVMCVHTHTHTANLIQSEPSDTSYAFPFSSCLSPFHLKTYQAPDSS